MDNWNGTDAQVLKQFMAKNPKVMVELEKRMPAIVTDGTMEQGAMSGAAHKGAEEILNALRDMQDMVPSEHAQGFIDPSAD